MSGVDVARTRFTEVVSSAPRTRANLTGMKGPHVCSQDRTGIINSCSFASERSSSKIQ